MISYHAKLACPMINKVTDYIVIYNIIYIYSKIIPLPWLGFFRGVFLVNHLAAH